MKRKHFALIPTMLLICCIVISLNGCDGTGPDKQKNRNDNTASVYANLEEYQYHGSIYGTIAAKRGFLKPVGEWNTEEVEFIGSKVKITLNGEVILDGDIADARENGTKDGKKHPGLKRDKGYIGFLGHGSELKFRNLRIKDLSK